MLLLLNELVQLYALLQFELLQLCVRPLLVLLLLLRERPQLYVPLQFELLLLYALPPHDEPLLLFLLLLFVVLPKQP